jgi:hypothetical protein
MKRKIRKPRPIYESAFSSSKGAYLLDNSYDFRIKIVTNFFTLSDAKILHKWLGKAIEYLEQGKK